MGMKRSFPAFALLVTLMVILLQVQHTTSQTQPGGTPCDTGCGSYCVRSDKPGGCYFDLDCYYQCYVDNCHTNPPGGGVNGIEVVRPTSGLQYSCKLACSDHLCNKSRHGCRQKMIRCVEEECSKRYCTSNT